jgi:hypothetical protein
VLRLLATNTKHEGVQSRHHGSGIFRGRPGTIIGRQLGKVSSHNHKSKVTVARTDQDAFQIGALGLLPSPRLLVLAM